MWHDSEIFRSIGFKRVVLTLLGTGSLILGGMAVGSTSIVLATSPLLKAEIPANQAAQIYDFTMDDIDGKPRQLSEFKGKVLMVVNTASFCGNTPQYEGLQTLYEQYREQGFTILAFPANDFGKQEPGNNKEIAEFCYTKYSLEFPLFSKITVLGDQKHPLYRYLTEQTAFQGEIKWNFQKFLIDRDGQVIARYSPKEKPLTPQIMEDIEKALKSS